MQSTSMSAGATGPIGPATPGPTGQVVVVISVFLLIGILLLELMLSLMIIIFSVLLISPTVIISLMIIISSLIIISLIVIKLLSLILHLALRARPLAPGPLGPRCQAKWAGGAVSPGIILSYKNGSSTFIASNFNASNVTDSIPIGIEIS